MLSSTSRKVAQWVETSKQVFSSWLEKNIRAAEQDIIGVTINSDYLKILKITKHPEHHQVDYFFVDAIPTGLVSKNTITDIPKLSNILKGVLANAGLSTRNIAITLPRSAAIIKNINLDSRLTRDEIETRVWMEANRLFPDLISDIYLDFVVNTSAVNESDQNEVTIIACRKNQIEPYMSLAEQSGTVLKVVDINHYALERAIPLISSQVSDTKTVGILSISYANIHLVVVQDGVQIYSHELNYDGSALRKIHQEGQADVLSQHLGSHLKHLMQFFYTSRPSVWIDKLILSDDCAAHVPHLVQFVKEATNKDAILAKPFEQMKISPYLDSKRLELLAPSLLLCSGVAMSRVG